MAGLSSIGLFAPAWKVECLKKGEMGREDTCAELQAIEDAARAEAKAKEEAAKKAAPAFTGTPASAPSTSTAAINNAAARFKDCDGAFRGPGGHTTCR